MISPVKIWRSQKKLSKLINRRGKILSYTIIRVPASNFSSQAPYPVVLVKLDGGKVIVAQMVDWEMENLKVGNEVVTVIRNIMETGSEGIIPYGIKVKAV
jgi:uncharacterized OB-fold protein